jgi:hypothetical protein
MNEPKLNTIYIVRIPIPSVIRRVFFNLDESTHIQYKANGHNIHAP